MTRFSYHPEIIETYPTIRAGAIYATGVTNGPSSDPLRKAFEAEQEAVISRIGGQLLSELAEIVAWRRVFSSFGVSPTQYRNAAEALLRRLTKRGDVPSINTLVDVANLVSIRYRLPVAVFDQRAVVGSTVVRSAEGTERFTDLGSGETAAPEPGEIIFVDDSGRVSARRWCWRQSRESAAGSDTVEILITVEGHHHGADATVDAATTDLLELLQAFAPPSFVVTAQLSPERPALD